MRFPDGTSPEDALSIARETGDLAALGELSLLSALRVSWSLPGRLLAPLEPAVGFTCSLPRDVALRRMGTVAAMLDLTPAVTQPALLETAGALREAGFSLAVRTLEPELLEDDLRGLQPELWALPESVWAGDEAYLERLIGAARDRGALVLAFGVEQPGQLAHLRRLGLDLATGPHLGRSAPATAWTPTRISMSWPREASR